MEFCKKCGGILVPEKRGKQTYMVCRNCGYKTKSVPKSLKIKNEVEQRGVVVLENNQVTLPVTDKMCPKCENTKAYFWLQQTRAADEPPTQFFKCTVCGHTWREYK